MVLSKVPLCLQILAAVTDNTVRVWDAATGVQLHVLKVHTAPVFVLECHPSDPRLAMSASYDGQTVVWDIQSGRDVVKCASIMTASSRVARMHDLWFCRTQMLVGGC